MAKRKAARATTRRKVAARKKVAPAKKRRRAAPAAKAKRAKRAKPPARPKSRAGTTRRKTPRRAASVKAKRGRKPVTAPRASRPTGKAASRRKTAATKRPAPKKAAGKKPAPKAVASKKRARKALATKKPPRKAVAVKKRAPKVVAAMKPRHPLVSPPPAVPPAPVTRRSRRAPRKLPRLERQRRTIPDDDSWGPPSSLDLNRDASSFRTGRRELRERYDVHTETSPALTGGDVDADWESAYSVGDEAPGGDNPTPDQGVVEDIGKAVGVRYDDNEELKGEQKIIERDRHRWELDPASSDDYSDRD